MSAARTNLSSLQWKIHRNKILGTGPFRIAYAATYIGGNRNGQEAVAKCFKSQYAPLEDDFFRSDYQIADHAIEFAGEWNSMCENKKKILMTMGDVATLDNRKYLMEPLIRYFTKFTSNNGWIASQDDEGWQVLAMEAFTHYTYYRSEGEMIVCDLQGRYRNDRSKSNRCRFELTDPAICSRYRTYGPTDMGEKGIESFFANHRCNRFCDADWARPISTHRWFAASPSTSMLRWDNRSETVNGVTYTVGIPLAQMGNCTARIWPIRKYEDDDYPPLDDDSEDDDDDSY